jgi:lysine decarboxylase
MADDRHTADQLLAALTAWRPACETLPPPPIRLPDPAELELETVPASSDP